MNKKFSIFLLFAGHSAWKVLLTLVLMAAAQLGAFWMTMPDVTTHSLEAALYVTRTALLIPLLLGFALVVGLLGRDGARGKHKLGYTLDRLALSPAEVLTIQSLYCFLGLVLFWAAEVAAILGIFALYQSAGGIVGPQTFYLVTWQDDLIHSFLPMEEVTRWLVLVITGLGLAVTTACGAAQSRAGNKPKAIVVLVALVVVDFLRPMGSTTSDLISVVLVLAVTAVALYTFRLLRKEELSNEETTSD